MQKTLLATPFAILIDAGDDWNSLLKYDYNLTDEVIYCQANLARVIILHQLNKIPGLNNDFCQSTTP